MIITGCTSQPAKEVDGPWRAKLFVDKMADLEYVHFSTDSEDAAWSNRKATLTLSKSCYRDHFSEVYVTHPWPVEARQEINIRIDSGPIAAAGADVGEPSQSTIRFRNAKKFASKLEKAKTLLVQYRDLTGKSVIAEFKIDGLPGVRPREKEICGLRK